MPKRSGGRRGCASAPRSGRRSDARTIPSSSAGPCPGPQRPHRPRPTGAAAGMPRAGRPAAAPEEPERLAVAAVPPAERPPTPRSRRRCSRRREAPVRPRGQVKFAERPTASDAGARPSCSEMLVAPTLAAMLPCHAPGGRTRRAGRGLLHYAFGLADASTARDDVADRQRRRRARGRAGDAGGEPSSTRVRDAGIPRGRRRTPAGERDLRRLAAAWARILSRPSQRRRRRSHHQRRYASPGHAARHAGHDRSRGRRSPRRCAQRPGLRPAARRRPRPRRLPPFCAASTACGLVAGHGEGSRREFLWFRARRRRGRRPPGDERIFGAAAPPPADEERALFFGDLRRHKGLEAFGRPSFVAARRPGAGLPSPGRRRGLTSTRLAARLGGASHGRAEVRLCSRPLGKVAEPLRARPHDRDAVSRATQTGAAPRMTMGPPLSRATWGTWPPQPVTER